MASALIDVNNDGVDELFVGGGLGQEDGLFAYKDGAAWLDYNVVCYY